MRALITGITGFAGGYLAEHLLEQGHELLGVSSRGRWGRQSPLELQDRVPLAQWNVAQPAPAEAARSIRDFRPDCIFHLAAISIPADCGPDEPTAPARAVNVEGTRNVLDLCSATAPRPRLLLVSSSHVYAPVNRESPRVSETSPLGPTSGYGRTKLAAEEVVQRAARQGKIDAIIVRAFQHAGPRQSDRMMLAEWAAQFARGTNPVRVHRTNAYLDLTDVRDMVRAYRLLAERGKSGCVYNAGSGRCLRSGEVLETLRQLADPGREIQEISPEAKQDPIAVIDRLREATSWDVRIDWRQTVLDTWHYWRDRMVAQAT